MIRCSVRDPYLDKLIEVVEAGGDPVSVGIALHSGAVLRAYIRASSFFTEASRNETQRARERLAAEPEKKHDARLRIATVLADHMERLHSGWRDDKAESDAITLSDVVMLWHTGDGLRLKTMRLDVNAIAGWWVLEGTAIIAPKEKSGFWAVGVTF